MPTRHTVWHDQRMWKKSFSFSPAVNCNLRQTAASTGSSLTKARASIAGEETERCCVLMTLLRALPWERTLLRELQHTSSKQFVYKHVHFPRSGARPLVFLSVDGSHSSCSWILHISGLLFPWLPGPQGQGAQPNSTFQLVTQRRERGQGGACLATAWLHPLCCGRTRPAQATELTEELTTADAATQRQTLTGRTSTWVPESNQNKPLWKTPSPRAGSPYGSRILLPQLSGWLRRMGWTWRNTWRAGSSQLVDTRIPRTQNNHRLLQRAGMQGAERRTHLPMSSWSANFSSLKPNWSIKLDVICCIW